MDFLLLYFFNITNVNRCDPVHTADLLFHHPPSHIWVPTTVTMTTPLKLDRRWLHGPACEKQSDSLLLSLRPFFAPSVLSFGAYLRLPQLLNRPRRRFQLFILFFSPWKVPGCSGRFSFFYLLLPPAFLLLLFPCWVTDGFCLLRSCACKHSILHIAMVTQMLMLSSCIILRTCCPDRRCRRTDRALYS